MAKNLRVEEQTDRRLPKKARSQAVAVVVDVVAEIEAVKEEEVVVDKVEENIEIDHKLLRMATRPITTIVNTTTNKEMKVAEAVEEESVAVAEIVVIVNRIRTPGFTSTIIWRECNMKKLSSTRTLSFLPCRPRRKDLKNQTRMSSTKKCAWKTTRSEKNATSKTTSVGSAGRLSTEEK